MGRFGWARRPGSGSLRTQNCAASINERCGKCAIAMAAGNPGVGEICRVATGAASRVGTGRAGRPLARPRRRPCRGSSGGLVAVAGRRRGGRVLALLEGRICEAPQRGSGDPSPSAAPSRPVRSQSRLNANPARERESHEAMGPMGFEVALVWPLALVVVTSEKM